MKNDFSYFNKKMTEQETAGMNLMKQRAMGSVKFEYPEPVQGMYVTQVAKMELRSIKEKNGVPCFYMEMSLIEGVDDKTRKFLENWPGKKHPKIIVKMPMAGTKNDASCIGMVTGLASRLHETTETCFTGDFNKLAEDIASLRNSIDDTYAYLVTYTPGDFFKICIHEILRSGEQEPPEDYWPELPCDPDPEPEPGMQEMHDLFLEEELPFN